MGRCWKERNWPRHVRVIPPGPANAGATWSARKSKRSPNIQFKDNNKVTDWIRKEGDETNISAAYEETSETKSHLYLWNYFILFLESVASNSTSYFADFHKLWSCVHEPSMQKKENTLVCLGWAQSTHRIYGFKGCGVGLGICKGFDCQICARPLAAKWHDTGTAWLAASPKLQRALPGQLSHSVAATQSENWSLVY